MGGSEPWISIHAGRLQLECVRRCELGPVDGVESAALEGFDVSLVSRA